MCASVQSRKPLLSIQWSCEEGKKLAFEPRLCSSRDIPGAMFILEKPNQPTATVVVRASAVPEVVSSRQKEWSKII